MNLDELERMLKQLASPEAARLSIYELAYLNDQKNVALTAAAEELVRDARRYREAEELGRYQDCGDKHRDWLSVGAWLYPGDRIVVVRDAIAQERKE